MMEIVIFDILSIEQYLLNLLTNIVLLFNTTCIVIVIDTILITHNYTYIAPSSK